MTASSDISGEIGELQTQNGKLETSQSAYYQKAETLRTPAVSIDDLALTTFTNMNDQKTILVNLGGNVGLGSTCYSSDTSYLTTNYGITITGVATALGIDLGIVGVGTTQVVGYATVYYDTLTAYRYPEVETTTGVTSAPSPGSSVESGGAFVGITTLNIGIGASTRFTANAGSIAGKVYSLVSNCHTGLAGSISAAVSSYTSGNSGITSYVSSVTSIKELKKIEQFKYWTISKKISDNNTTISNLNGVVNILDDPGFGGPY